MNKTIFNVEESIINELTFQTTRSSGKGGQNVNKVSSKVILIFDIDKSKILNNEQKQLLHQKYPGKINKEGQFHLSASKDRSQLMNKKDVIERFFKLLYKAFEPEIERIGTKPTRSSIVRRKEGKSMQSEKKQLRRKVINNE